MRVGRENGARRRGKETKAAKRRAKPLEQIHPATAKLAVALREYKEAVEQQAATVEILRALARSSRDPQAVFQAIVENAHRLCGALYTVLHRYDGQMVRILADKHLSPKAMRVLREIYPEPPRRDKYVGLAILEGRTIHSADVPNDPRFPGNRNVSKVWPRRAAIAVPLLRDGAVLGAIACGRLEPKPFSKREIALLQTFADQAVIALENVRLFNETKEALERQTATGAILRVIAGTPADAQPVFDAIAQSALRLFGVSHVGITLREGDLIRSKATAGSADPRGDFAIPLNRDSTAGRCMLDRTVIDVGDTEAPDAPRFARESGRIVGFRAIAAAPMLREGVAMGSIHMMRKEPGPFSDTQIELLKTFADQAVIAIENARLFNETNEALEKQTATAEILRVISSSPADTQPVFEAIVRNATRLCEAVYANVFRYDGELIHWQASHGWPPELLTELKNNFPMRANPSRVAGRVVLSGQAVRLEDTRADPEYDQPLAKALRYRKILGVPLLRDGRVLGALTVGWSEPGPVAQRHEDLLKTFADQAVIAIENVRLFNETKEALEQQTAISEVLRVISDSPTDVKPVLDAVAVRAARICEASDARIWLVEGDSVRHVAGFGDVPMPVKLGDALPLDRGTVSGRAIIERAPVHVEDMAKLSRDDYPISREMQERSGFRTILAVPLMREQRALGAIMLRRLEVRSFTDKQIALLKTFADQAAIAIENVRLFNETKEALDQQTSTAEVLKTISRSTFDLGSVLQTLLDNATRLSGARQAVMLRPDAKGNYLPAVTFNYPADSPVIARLREHPIRPGHDSTSGRVLLERKPIHIADVLADPEYRRRDLVEVGGYRTVLSVPMLRDGEAIGLITLNKGEEVDPFTEKQMEVVTTFADQAVIAIENVRLFKEIEEKSAQLEVANKHKSDFLANMSHELRTPLNAIIGFSEALMEKMFGELNDKQSDYLKDIHESGKHLLSLINDILDLSKIEAGRMDLEMSSFHLPTALSNAMTLVRERAQRHAIELGLEVDERLGEFQADERKFKQIMLNLLSNAVKFTPDGGRVDVCAKQDTDKIEIAVKDTGIGIAPEDQAAVFEEFKQVGRDQMKKAEGTGLGLALTRRFVELHGGAIRLESTPGKGSTFTVSLPLRQ